MDSSNIETYINIETENDIDASYMKTSINIDTTNDTNRDTQDVILKELSSMVSLYDDTFNIFLETNKYDILNILYDLFVEYIDNNIIYMYLESFENDMIYDTIQLCVIIMNNQFPDLDVDSLNDSIIFNEYINTSLKLLYSEYIPLRSYNYSFIRKEINKELIKNKIEYIRNKDQPEQRTDEWYAYRSNLITASNAWKIFDSECNRNSIIYEKCKPYENYSGGFQNMDSTLHWGQKYEPLSIMIYECIYGTQIEDFGCIQHDNVKCLGASPDGINTKENNERFGRMLEIKNIVNREITQIPKKEYWIQMQLQMEVCNLNECDFLETRFIEYTCENEFLNDGDEFITKDGNKKGIILCFHNTISPIYEYYLHELHGNYEEWEKHIYNKNHELTFIKTIYWKLDELSCILVLRNKKWFNIAKPMIEDLWNIVLKERNEGYEHRAPKKRARSLSVSSDIDANTLNKNCKINIDTISLSDFE